VIKEKPRRLSALQAWQPAPLGWVVWKFFQKLAGGALVVVDEALMAWIFQPCRLPSTTAAEAISASAAMSIARSDKRMGCRVELPTKCWNLRTVPATLLKIISTPG
jgi:hypothetical protein